MNRRGHGLHIRLMFSLFIIVISISAGIILQGQTDIIRENFRIAVFSGGLAVIVIVIISQRFVQGSKYDKYEWQT